MTPTDPDATRAWLLSKVQDDTLTLSSALSPAAGALAHALSVASVDVHHPRPGLGDALVTGAATILGQAATVTLGGGSTPSPWLSLSMPWPAGVAFATLFGAGPTWWARTGGRGTMAPQGSFLDRMVAAGATLVIRSEADADGGLAAGINLRGPLAVSGLAGSVFADALAFATTGKSVTGTIVPATTTTSVPALADLRVTLPTLPFTLPGLPPVSPFVWLRATYDAATQVGESVVAVAVATRLGSPAPVELILAAGVDAGDGLITFELISDGSATLGNGLADVAHLLSVSADDVRLPSQIGGLSHLALDDLRITVDLSNHSITSAFVAVSLAPGTVWSLPVGDVSVTGLSTRWQWLARPRQPASGSRPMFPALSGVVHGQLVVGRDRDVVIDVGVALPDLIVTGSLSSTLPLAKLLPDALAAVFSAVPQLAHASVANLAVTVDAGTSPSFALSLAITDAWTGALGALSSFRIDSLLGTMQHDPDGGWRFSLAGTACLGGTEIILTWTYGPSFAITAVVEELKVGALVAGLTGGGFALPPWADFTLSTLSLAITESGTGWTLAVAATIGGWGRGFVTLIDGGGGWGFAVGVDVTAFSSLGDAPGLGFLAGLGLTIEDLIAIVSSVALPAGFTLPVPVNATGRPVRIPAGVGAPQPGVSFYGSFRFGDPSQTTHSALRQLYRFLGITPAMALELELAASVSEGAEGMEASIIIGAELGADGTPATTGPIQPPTTHGLDLALYLGAEVGSTTALFLRGLLTLPIGQPDSRPRFGIEIDLEAEGIIASGSMLGPWPSPFGLKGLTVSDAAVVIGADWDGIPTVGFAGELSFGTFDGSLALLLNTVNPAQSVFAASLDELSPGDLVRVLVPEAARTIPEGVLAALDSLGLTGIPLGTVEVTPALTRALDRGDVAAVAASLSAAGLTLSPSVTDTLVVTGVAGKRWYVTDRRAAPPRNIPCHYQLVAVDGAITITLDPQFYAAPQATTIGQLRYPFGLAAFSRLDLHGWTADVAIAIGSTTGLIPYGITVSARLDKVSWFGGALTLARAHDDGFAEPGDGPYLSIATSPSTVNGATVPPHVAASGALTILGLDVASAAIVIEATALHAELDTAFADGQLALDWTVRPLHLSGGGRAALSLSFDVDLSRVGLGTYHAVGVAISADIALDFSASHVGGTASGSFSLDVTGFGSLGPYSVSATLDASHGLDQLESWLGDAARKLVRVGDELGTLLTRSADAFVRLVEAGVISLRDSLDAVLARVFGIGGGDAAITGCFAHRLVDSAARVRAMGGGDAGGEPIATLPAGQLDALRGLRADLGHSAMGRWLLDIYDHISRPLVDLYDRNPSVTVGGASHTFQQLVATYHGKQAFDELIAVLRTSGAFAGDTTLIQDLEYLIQGVLTFVPTGVIADGVNALLGQLGLLASYIRQGLTYRQMIGALPSVIPPASPFTGAPTASGAPPAAATATPPRPAPTPWESFLTPLLEVFISEIPGWVRTGFSADGNTFPPMTSVSVPDQPDIDLREPLALCPLFSTDAPGSTTRADLTQGTVTGLDTLGPGGAITYPVPDLQIAIPLRLGSLALNTTWTTHSACCSGDGPPTVVDHSGTLTAPFVEVALAIHVTLSPPTDTALPRVIALDLSIVDDAAWKGQPVIDPERDLTVDASVPPAMRAIIAAGLGGGVVGPMLRARAQEVVRSPRLARAITAKLNAAIAGFAGAGARLTAGASMPDAIFTINAAGLDLVTARYVAANPSMFSGVQADDGLGIEMDYQTGTPSVDLAPSSAGKNIALNFPAVAITTYQRSGGQRGPKISSLQAKLTIAGNLALHGQALALSELAASGVTFQDKLAAALFNSKVLPSISSAVASIPLPDVRRLTHLPITLTGLAIVNRVVRIDASLGVGAGTPAIVLEPGGMPAMTCAVSGAAIQALAARAAGFPATADKSARGHVGKWPFRLSWSADANASVDSLSFSVNSGQAHASVHVSAGCSAKFEGLGPHIEIPATTPSVNVSISHDGQDAKIYFQLPAPPNLVPHLPGVLDKISGSIRDLVNGLAEATELVINDRLSRATVTLFSLPEAISFVGVSATLGWSRLEWEANAAVAVIGLS